MLGKTHKAFGCACLGAIGIAYSSVTGSDLTHTIVPTYRELWEDPQWTTALVSQFENMSYARLTMALLIFGGAFMGSIYPDIDQDLPIKHRGITHTIWFVLGLIGIYIVLHSWAPFGVMWTHIVLLPPIFGMIVGYMSHLVADAFSTSGIAWFYPLQRYQRYPSGAEVVEGNRFIFQPIYKVGQRFCGIPGSLIWWLIAIPLTLIWLLTVK